MVIKSVEVPAGDDAGKGLEVGVGGFGGAAYPDQGDHPLSRPRPLVNLAVQQVADPPARLIFHPLRFRDLAGLQ